MICLYCKKLDLQKHQKHSPVGLGVCTHESEGGVFVSFAYRRSCQEFEEADAEIAQKRIEWWNKLQEKK